MRKNTPLGKLLFCVLCALVLSISSCSARISGSLNNESAGSFTVTASLQPRISALIHSLRSLSGEQGQDQQIIDGRTIAESMTRAPGVASVSFENTSPQSIEGPVRISRIGDFLSSGGEGFIRFEQGQGAGGRCTIDLRRELGPAILSRVSAEVTAYLEALMAPIATGEEINGEEYLELVESVYGKGVADEIAVSTIRASVDFPGVIQNAEGGTFSGRRVEFEIPLLDLLVLEEPLTYEVIWN